VSVLVVTGTGTGVGKTVTTAALAACGLRAGQRVAVVKPVQTGVRPGEPGDLAELARRVAGLADRDLVLVEGAGGALVRFNDRDETICTLATELRRLGSRVRVVMVTGSALGALHDAAATAAALASRSLGPDALVVGDWPAEPGLAERCNLLDLPGYAGAPVAGVLPHGAGDLPAAAFAEMAAARLAPTLGGSFDAAGFLRAHAAPPPVSADPTDPADPAVPSDDHGHATVPNRESPR
jgi:dethiobiotin synthetase